ncbi:beta-galactosidase, partial [Enterococcus casseliflavus]|uniref:beta-galactosidase n=1 Tax=Enterococcus casseliflavus TaxID=37734 RepID=UPI003A4C7A20
EFMWRDLEPQPGEYDFSLLERALEQYQANGIDVCLCIPTPIPPVNQNAANQNKFQWTKECYHVDCALFQQQDEHDFREKFNCGSRG